MTATESGKIPQVKSETLEEPEGIPTLEDLVIPERCPGCKQPLDVVRTYENFSWLLTRYTGTRAKKGKMEWEKHSTDGEMLDVTLYCNSCLADIPLRVRVEPRKKA
jgi:uncharacterized protein YbaR (Trm112 family)